VHPEAARLGWVDLALADPPLADVTEPLESIRVVGWPWRRANRGGMEGRVATSRPPGLVAPGAGRLLPDVDDRLVHPGARYEILDGHLIAAPPADPPHATRHLSLAYVLAAHVSGGYVGAVDMLMRADETSDIAPDASVYPEGEAPGGGRKLEELAFEVTSEQRLSVPTEKARKLIARGVRRVFCLLVKEERRVLEWSRETDGWSRLLDTAVIDDACFVRPMRVIALIDAAAADDDVAEALLRKQNPVIERMRAEERRQGLEQGLERGISQGRQEALVSAILAVLDARGLEVGAATLERLRACHDEAKLVLWHRRAATAASGKEALVE